MDQKNGFYGTMTKEPAGRDEDLICGSRESSRNPNVFSRARELAALTRLLDKRGLSLPVGAFSDLIAEGDVFEVYDENGQQIYRNWSFYRYSTYSAVDQIRYDWHELFVRPKWIEAHLRGLFPFFFRPRAGVLKYDLPEHFIYERYGDPKRISLVKMKYASPLLCKYTDRPLAFITTGRTRDLAAEIRSGVLPLI